MNPERDLTQPIIAYRAWGVVNGRLSSYGVTSAWPTLKPCVALCLAEHGGNAYNGIFGVDLPVPKPHNAPGYECRCGLYGFADEATLRQVIEAPILGRVALWGTVVVCGEGDTVSGYRAEFAYPQVLYYQGDAEQKASIKALAAAYGIDAVPMPQALVETRERSRDELSSSTIRAAYITLQQNTATDAQLASMLNAAQSSYMQMMGGLQNAAAHSMGQHPLGYAILDLLPRGTPTAMLHDEPWYVKVFDWLFVQPVKRVVELIERMLL